MLRSGVVRWTVVVVVVVVSKQPVGAMMGARRRRDAAVPTPLGHPHAQEVHVRVGGSDAGCRAAEQADRVEPAAPASRVRGVGAGVEGAGGRARVARQRDRAPAVVSRPLVTRGTKHNMGKRSY